MEKTEVECDSIRLQLTSGRGRFVEEITVGSYIFILHQGSSTGGPGHLGGPQNYYRESSKSSNPIYINNLNPSVHILRTVAKNSRSTSCELVDRLFFVTLTTSSELVKYNYMLHPWD